MLDYSMYKVAVIGDVMLDVWYEAEEVKVSPEAPVLDIINPKPAYSPGGAANVAVNVASLGADCWLLGLTGEDTNSGILERFLTDVKYWFWCDVDGVTTTKSRYLRDGHQIVRISQDGKMLFDDSISHSYLDHDLDAIIIADYNKGMMTPKVIKSVMDYAKERDIITIVDPKYDNWDCYHGCTIFKPNMTEAVRVVKWGGYSEQAWRVAQKVNCDWCILTLGSLGMFVGSKTDKKGHTDFPPRIEAHKVPVSNVCGAGDTVSAVLALEYLRTKDIFKAAELANYAASLVVQKPRTGTVTAEELEEWAIDAVTLV